MLLCDVLRESWSSRASIRFHHHLELVSNDRPEHSERSDLLAESFKPSSKINRVEEKCQKRRLINKTQQLLRRLQRFLPCETPRSHSYLCSGTKTPQTAQLQSIYYCSIMEDVATQERAGTQNMNANEPYSQTKRH